MRIRHIYITKEGEPMANPEMEYPERHTDCPKNYPDFSDECVRRTDGKKLCKCEDYNLTLQRYHSGLLPFEDAKQVNLILASTRFTFPVWLANIIPADLEVGVVEKWKFSLDSQWRDVTEDHGPKTEEEREAQGNEYRKVLRIKP